MKIPYGLTIGSPGLKLPIPDRQYPADGARFETVMNDLSQAVNEGNGGSLEERALETLVRMIEEQVRDHRLYSICREGWMRSESMQTRYRQGNNPASSINRHSAENTKDTLTSPDRIGSIINRSAEEYGVDAGLVRAVIKTESDFDPRATSPKGAMGLMQLMPETALDLGVKDPYNPSENVMAGTRYLKKLLDRYNGNTDVALAAYNWGMGNVERNPGKLPEETKNYIARVSRYRNQAPT